MTKKNKGTGTGIQTGWRRPAEAEKQRLDRYFQSEQGGIRRTFSVSGAAFGALGLILFAAGVMREVPSQTVFCWILAVLFLGIGIYFLWHMAAAGKILKKGLRGEYLIQYCFPVWSAPFTRNPNRGHVQVKTENGELCELTLEIDGVTEQKIRKEKRQERMILLTMPEEGWTSVATGRQME